MCVRINHAGPSFAYHQKKSHTVCRPDYALVPTAWKASQVQSYPGLDGLPPELCKVFATDLAAWLHPIYMKIAWRGSEPTGWKGESSVYFYKNRGRHDDCLPLGLAPIDVGKGVSQVLEGAPQAPFREGHASPSARRQEWMFCDIRKPPCAHCCTMCYGSKPCQLGYLRGNSLVLL